MSKIEDLIRQYCPNGCEWKRLGDTSLFRISRGVVISKSYIAEHQGQYPVYSSQTENDGCLGCIDTYDVDGERITWTTDGAKAGTIFYRSGKYNITNVCGMIECVSSDISCKYVSYVFGVEAPKFVNKAMGNCKLMSNVVENILIPIPHIAVQEEIVRILDEFTELEKELEKELEMRKKQYEWYRDELLTFGDEVERHDITEVFDLRNGYTPSKSVKEYWENGTVDWFRMEDIREHGNVLSEATQKVSESAVKGGKKIKANSIALATTATIGEHALIIVDCLGNQRFTFFTKSELFFDKVNMNFMNYYFFKIDEWCKTHTRQGNFASVDMDALKQLQIPVPPLQEQQRIVEILDTFDTLTTDLTKGLPAEIKMRHMQYEYYRDYLFGLLK